MKEGDIVKRMRKENEYIRGMIFSSLGMGRLPNCVELMSEASAEIEKLREALKQEREQCALAAESTTCDVSETNDYYSGFCDGVTEATAAIRARGVTYD